jgi:hypothetical protein
MSKSPENDGQDEIPRFLSTKGLVSICVGGQNNMLLLTNLPILFFPHLAPHTSIIVSAKNRQISS